MLSVDWMFDRHMSLQLKIEKRKLNVIYKHHLYAPQSELSDQEIEELRMQCYREYWPRHSGKWPEWSQTDQDVSDSVEEMDMDWGLRKVHGSYSGTRCTTCYLQWITFNNRRNTWSHAAVAWEHQWSTTSWSMSKTDSVQDYIWWKYTSINLVEKLMTRITILVCEGSPERK